MPRLPLFRDIRHRRRVAALAADRRLLRDIGLTADADEINAAQRRAFTEKEQ
ncbi:hypothetical protein [Litorisediminicola beolgyonensis]|uniref:DUF1127 domain-containing protein n=1 Tax=Litorisediminicola beolgyonensis TaxID=1173614 RepID=A0ABW3ZFE1_9RHOB